MARFVKSLSELSKSDADIAGGKGASLGEMIQAGFPVPPGFVVITEAYNRFSHEPDLPEEVREEILVAFDNLATERVAVRSSATAEDSAEHVWAGQLDSYLKVGQEDLIENIRKCWASLSSPRACAYRAEKGLQNESVSVAVVVQKMVDAEKAGVAFSVHPVTEDHNQIIIEAGIGLGEAVVSGSITPDSYIVSREQREIVDITLSGSEQILSEEEIVELTKLVLKIEQHYGFPCDIEWAIEKAQFHILQSRPITTLSKEL